jgi:hypothetical protein
MRYSSREDNPLADGRKSGLPGAAKWELAPWPGACAREVASNRYQVINKAGRTEGASRLLHLQLRWRRAVTARAPYCYLLLGP